jgi:hypothetical protein
MAQAGFPMFKYLHSPVESKIANIQLILQIFVYLLMDTVIKMRISTYFKAGFTVFAT